MFGTNPVMKAEHTNGEMLQVVKGSPFLTIQGEGPYAGRPAVFIRLHGCNQKCYFCDTEFSDPSDPLVPTVDLVQKVKDLIAGTGVTLVVITGGEPARQTLNTLVHKLREISPRLTLQMETAGTLWQECFGWLEIVVSPKTQTIHPEIEEVAIAYKYIISDTDEFSLEDGLPTMSTQRRGGKCHLARPASGIPVYLSPMDEYDPAKNKANIQAVVRRAVQHGYIAGLQLHKIMGLP